MNHASPSLREFLKSVSDEIPRKELKDLKFICKDDISQLRHDQLDKINGPLELLELLLKEGLIKHSDLSYLADKLDKILLLSLRNKVQEYNNNIQDGSNHNTYRKPRIYGYKEKKFPFLGRDDMVNDIFNEFRRQNSKMVVVLGPPGFGKSEVVNHAGHKLYEEGSFSVIFVCMRNIRTVDALCESILKAVINEPNYSKTDNVVDQVKNILVSLESPTVLILDNCQDIQNSTDEQQQDNFQKFIEYVGRYAVMVTLLLGTRNDITTYEFESQSMKIEPLKGDYPAKLLRKLAPEIDNATAEKLGKACNGVPLLIFLAGKQVHNGYNPNKLAEDLKYNLHKFVKIEKYLYNSIQVFLNSFDIDIRRALVKLANFARSFTEEEVQELYINDSCDCSNMLSCLCKNALLQLHDGQYSIHPLIQSFCRKEQEQIGCAEEGQKANRDFTVHYLNKLETIHRQFESKEFPEALEAYEDNKMNIEQARQNALKSDCKEIKVKCIDAFNNSINILAKVMNPSQCHTVYQELHKEASDLNNTKQIAKCNVSIGFRYLLDHNHLKFSEEAFDSLLNAYKLFQSLPQKERESEDFAHCLSKLALCYWLKEDRVQGKKLADQAADLRHRLENRVYIAAGHCDRAIAAMFDKDFHTAIGIFRNHCCSTYRSNLGDHPWLATSLTYMSQCYKDLSKHDKLNKFDKLKKLDKAIENIQESLEIRKRTLGDHQDTARSYVFLAELREMKGELEQALENYKNALTIQKKVLQYHDETINTLETCANILQTLNKTDEYDAMVKETENYSREHRRRMFAQRQISDQSRTRSHSHLESKKQEQFSKRVKAIIAVVCVALCMLIIFVNSN